MPSMNRKEPGEQMTLKPARRDQGKTIVNGTQLIGISVSSHFFVNLTPESPGACKPESSSEVGTNSPLTIEAHPEGRKLESLKSSSISSELRTSGSDSPILDSSSRNTITPTPSPRSDIVGKIDPRLFNEPNHPDLSSMETVDLAGVNP